MSPMYPGPAASTPPPKTTNDKDKLVRWTTDCLGCGADEGAFHRKDCEFREDTRERRTITIDVTYLAKTYGINPWWASLDSQGRLTIRGPRIGDKRAVQERKAKGLHAHP